MDIQLQVGVKVLLKNQEGKYLLLRRAVDSKAAQKNSQGTWDMPGGRINPGTTLLENLARELMEETGLTMNSGPLLVAAQDIMKWSDRHVVRLTYRGTTEDGEPRLSEEHTEYKWFTLEEIKKLEDLDSYFKILLDAEVFDEHI
ncbi:MAG TPA: NUDIX domain-containing protein [Candidatus Paceibacterota bacterium]|nr:NUDIX domain-containing protein [Candidatus Paceibacterota bacterium]